jgi:hypothetical protein
MSVGESDRVIADGRLEDQSARVTDVVNGGEEGVKVDITLTQRYVSATTLSILDVDPAQQTTQCADIVVDIISFRGSIAGVVIRRQC